MTKRLLHSGCVSMIVSEEDENVIYPVRELSNFLPIIAQNLSKEGIKKAFFERPPKKISFRTFLTNEDDLGLQ